MKECIEKELPDSMANQSLPMMRADNAKASNDIGAPRVLNVRLMFEK